MVDSSIAPNGKHGNFHCGVTINKARTKLSYSRQILAFLKGRRGVEWVVAACVSDRIPNYFTSVVPTRSASWMNGIAKVHKKKW
jgi:hypothetical protein